MVIMNCFFVFNRTYYYRTFYVGTYVVHLELFETSFEALKNIEPVYNQINYTFYEKKLISGAYKLGG